MHSEGTQEEGNHQEGTQVEELEEVSSRMFGTKITSASVE